MSRSAKVLIALVMTLAVCGIIILASASQSIAEHKFGNAYHFLMRQAIFAVAAFGAAFVVSKVNYHHFSGKAALLLGIVSAALLVITLVVGKEINGSKRWLDLGPFNLQASELAKLTSIILTASWMAYMKRKTATFGKGLMVPMVALGLIAGLILLEPDYGTTLLVVAVGLCIMFMGGSRISHLVITSTIGLVGFSIMVMENPVRMQRIIAFLNPEKYASDEAFQLLNAMRAFIMGGVTGAGYCQGLQKEHFLPEAHTDFIYAILAEDGGLLASLLVVALFCGIFVCGLLISFKAHDQFGKLLAFGITVMITLQGLINMGVVTGCLPTKGLALPFVSYGGSSLIMSAVMVGILVNIARQNSDESLAGKNIPIKDGANWL
jgi:cell division protein FtsW